MGETKEIVTVETGEIDTQRQGFLPVRINKLEQLKALAKRHGKDLLYDMAGKTEPQAEYAVILDRVIYFTEKVEE